MKKIISIVALMILIILMTGNRTANAGTDIKPVEKKVLYLSTGGMDSDQGKTKSKDSIRYAKLLGITRKQAKKLKVTAVSSDDSVALCDDSVRKVTASGMGSATITLTCDSFKTDVRIVVKKHAREVYFGRDFSGDISEKVFETGVEYELSLPRSRDGVKMDTDLRRLVITNAKGKDVTDKLAKSTGNRLWTIKFNAESEYTLTGEAFQSEKKPGTTASAQIVIKTKAPKPAFSAEPAGVYTIKVTGDGFTSETPFSVKRGNTEVEISEISASKDGDSATLTLAGRISEAAYTVSDGVHSASFEAQDERAEEIVIAENGQSALMSDDRKSVYVHYDILNQYGESARKRFSVSWTSSFGILAGEDRNRGILEFKDAAGDGLQFGRTVVLTGVHTGTAGNVVTANAQFTAGFTRFVDKVEVMGIVELETKKIVKKVPANFKKGEYGIYFKLLDSLGFDMPYSKTQADNLTVTSLDQLTAGISYDGSCVIIEGEEYAYAVVTPGFYAKNGGKVSVRFISSKTGGDTSYTLKLAGGQVLDIFRILPCGDIITELASDAGDSDAYVLDFEAFDAEGEPVTEFSDLAGAVRLSGKGLKLVENNDGTAKLLYTPTNLGATEIVSVPVYLSATVLNNGHNEGLMMEVRQKRKPVEVREMVAVVAPYALNGCSYRIYTYKDDDNSYLSYNDQYGDKYICESRPTGCTVKVTDYDASLISIAPNNASKVSYFAVTVKDNAVSRSDTTYIEFALFDADGKEVNGSRKKIPLGLLDVTAFSSFTLKCKNSYTLKNADSSDESEFTVYGGLSDGTEVKVPNRYVKYYIPEMTVNTVSVAAINYYDRGDSAFNWYPNYAVSTGLPGTYDTFLDYSATKPDGTHPDRLLEVQIEARVCSLSGGAIDLDMTAGSASITKEVGNFNRKLEKLNTATTSSKHVKWISTSKKKAYISAENGVITAGFLIEALRSSGSGYKRGTDNYGKTKKIKNEDIIIELSAYQENKDALYADYNSTTGSYRINNNGLSMNAAGGDGARIINAEIGDTFTATYRYKDLGETNGEEVSVEVSFTVGADKKAYIDESISKPDWY
ncbi:MAG: hypothetical protein K6G81_01065 [Lachnospiraceae bacterium]|nr:hypothetical protein [Lachnospiraceae bacterium]